MSRLLLVVGAATTFGGAVAAGCVFDFDGCPDLLTCLGGTSTSSSGGGAGGTTSSTSSTGGSTSTAMGCTDASSCPAVPAGPCAALGQMTCTDHQCGVTYTAGPAPSQEYGSCQQNVCDANGKMTSMEADGNVLDDGNPCEPFVCAGGTSSLVPANVGAPCTRFGSVMGYCWVSPDPAFMTILVCAECDPQDDMCSTTTPGYVCDQGKCVPLSCKNGVKDTGETGTDCGGGFCLPCDAGQGCGAVSDCFSGICPPATHTCSAPSCTDNVKNGNETGIDCGGSCPTPCDDGQGCSTPTDCVSKVCAPSDGGVSCQTPSCTDGVQNGSETGVDCGGSCLPCAM